jgi:hypothetical protein
MLFSRAVQSVTAEPLFHLTQMLIQKVFHVRQSVDKAHARLSDFRYFGDRFGGVLRGSYDLELLPTDERYQVLFRSTGGDMELCGLMELLPIRDHLTEVQLTMEYEIQSPLRRTLNRLLGIVSRRVHREILEMKRQMDEEGARQAPARLEPSRCIPSVAGELHPAG